MSGLQRMGVLISVLWLLAVPSYLIISSNKFADAYYKGCLDLAYRTKLNSAAGACRVFDPLPTRCH